MKAHYRTATFQDGLIVASNLRPEDKKELERMGLSLLHVALGIFESEHPTAIISPDGDVCGVAGVVPLGNKVGQIWLLCTPDIGKSPIAFFRQAKVWLESIQKNYILLWNHCDSTNKVHHNLLKFLGFKAINKVYIGPELFPFYEIVKLCVPSQHQ